MPKFCDSIPNRKTTFILLLKFGTPFPPDAGIKTYIAFMSPNITPKKGVGLVVETGMNTEIGKIADLINSEEKCVNDATYLQNCVTSQEAISNTFSYIN